MRAYCDDVVVDPAHRVTRFPIPRCTISTRDKEQIGNGKKPHKVVGERNLSAALPLSDATSSPLLS